MLVDLLKHNNLFAINVVIFQCKTAQNMEKISFNLNVSFAVVLLNGFAGAILTSANLAINDSAMETM